MNKIFKLTERVMGMSEQTWQRHANPWSVYTRFSCLPLIALSVWSRVWIGDLFWLPFGLSMLWAYLNPRVFPKPLKTNSWASKATFGERVYMNKKVVPIPKHHERAAFILVLMCMPGTFLLGWGLFQLHGWMVICGLFGSILPKLWFVDRMVWLYEDMKEANDQYKSWLKF